MKAITALLLLAGPVSAYELHEWGTFTTVSGSDGVLLTGLEREEAALPIFAHSHLGLENGNVSMSNGFGKGMSRPVAGVTVKMETPVIYFHSDKAFDATVKVGFEGGTISQWYPERSGGEVLPAIPDSSDGFTPAQWMERIRVDFSKGWKGSIEWKARVLSPAESKDAILFKPGQTQHWVQPRVPEANVVQTPNGEKEGFLFYRGIGNFDPGLKITVGNDDTIKLSNNTGSAIPFVFVYEKQLGSYTRWRTLKNGVDAGAAAEVKMTDFTVRNSDMNKPDAAELFGHGEFNEAVYRDMVAGLKSTGLLESEARAMVETWWTSYFGANGLRVFWVVPEAKTAQILPLEVTPAPEKQVRVIVGRSEVLRPSKEQGYLTMSKSTEEQQALTWQSLVSTDRFGMAYKKRVEALAAGSTERKATAATR
ncbi:hypothetical protein [Haloferula sp. BvORR071]|uniref:hypothetical protein n=1 Tax=Haloferula sp. BvORR071 TaxID=1396141 RepID=UPI000553C874|nr:hypothetical protein [Haloferula sp. BvORR071]